MPKLSTIHFHKYQANGNDFLIIQTNFSCNPLSMWQQKATSLCNRHLGVGADGIIIVSVLDEKFLNIHVINKDGSEAKNCGNGLRAVAKWHYDLTGIKQTTIRLWGKNYPASITQEDLINVSMGQCIVEPFFPEVSLPKLEKAYLADLGNSHIVWFFASKPPHSDTLIESLKTMPNFSHFNHSLCWRDKNSLNATVYERGVGFTLACGSGAIACACAYSIWKSLKTTSKVQVNQPGGSLFITCHLTATKEQKHFFETSQLGPAKEVFLGQLPALLT